MRTYTLSRGRAATACVGAGALLLTTGLLGLGGSGAQASSHREAPLIAGDPQYDTTDVYAFRSPDRKDTVTLVANWIPFEEPSGGPNFYSFATDARYDIKIDNDGDAKADITYRWLFKDHYRTKATFLYNTGAVSSLTDPDLNYRQTYQLQRITDHGTNVVAKHLRVAPSFVGDASMPDYGALRDESVTWLGAAGKSGRSFAGQADDPFFLDLRVFDLLYGGDFSEVGDDTLEGFGVNSVALQVHRDQIAARRDAGASPIVGVWSTTSELGADGKYHRISRLGMPLVNELVIPLRDKDRFNASQPQDDAQFLRYVTNPEVPRLIEQIYGIPAPDTPRDDLVSVFLTGIDGLNQPDNVTPSEQLRLNMSTPVTEAPNRLGVIGGDNQGYPNGRRLTDDITDITLQVAEGELVGSPNDLGDGVNTNDKVFSDSFPYLALPTSGSDVTPHPTVAVSMLNGGVVPDEGFPAPSGIPVVPLLTIALGLVAVAGGSLIWLRRPGVAAA